MPEDKMAAYVTTEMMCATPMLESQYPSSMHLKITPEVKMEDAMDFRRKSRHSNLATTISTQDDLA